MHLSWFTYALIAGITNSLVGIFQKGAFKENKDVDPIAFSIYFQLLVGIIALFLLKFNLGTLPSDINVWIIALVDLLIYVSSTILYFICLKKIEVSEVRIISSIRPAWMLIGGLIFLKESISFLKIGGIILIMLGLCVVYWSSEGFKKFGATQIILVIYSIITAIGGIMDKYLLNYFSPVAYIVVSFIPVAVITSLLMPKSVPNIKPLLKFNKCGFLTIGSAMLMIVAAFSLYSAFKYGGEVSRVNPIWQASSVMTVILGILFLKERDNMFKKILGALIIFTGVIIIK